MDSPFIYLYEWDLIRSWLNFFTSVLLVCDAKMSEQPPSHQTVH